MIFIKAFENFDNGIEYLDMARHSALSYMTKKCRGLDEFRESELELFRRKFKKTNDLDYYLRGDKTVDESFTGKKQKISINFKTKDTTGSRITIYKFKDDYYLVIILRPHLVGFGDIEKVFDIDTMEGLREFIEEIPHHHNDLVRYENERKRRTK